MSRPAADVPRGSRPPGPAGSWYTAAGTAAVAAVVMLALHTDFVIIAAGVLAVGATGTALAGAWLRSRRPIAADVASVVVAALIFATALLSVLGVIMAHRPQP